MLVIEKDNDTAPCTCMIKNLNGDEIAGNFFEQEIQKTKLVLYNWEINKGKNWQITC